MQFLLLIFCLTAQANTIDEGARAALKWERPELAASVSDYTLAASVAGTLAYTGIHSRDRRLERLGAALGAYALNSGANFLVKSTARRLRPNGHDRLSFYSGHTSTAFVGAGVVCLQGEAVPCAIALGISSLVGYLRIAGDWHWLSDVAVGAGVGYSAGRFFPSVIVKF